MNRNKHLFVQLAQISGLTMLLFVQRAGFAQAATELKYSQALDPKEFIFNPKADIEPISKAEANKIETWLIGDIRDRNPIWADSSIEPERIKIVLARPNAKLELARIVARQDLAPKLRVYAQQILITTGQPANPSLVEAYCQTFPYEFKSSFWGFPGFGAGSFGKTLVGYGKAALPCLSNLLDDNNELRYGSGEASAISWIMRHRVADLAAYLIAQILHLPYNNTPNPTIRDQYIQVLRQHLTNSLSEGFVAESPNNCSQILQKTPSSLTAKSTSVSETDAKTVETWLLGDFCDFIFGVNQTFSERAAIVLAQPKASLELARIVSRQDLPPRLRVYAQQILMKAGQPAKPKLVGIYCQAVQDNKQRPFHDVWGVPSDETTSFAQTLIDYRHTALPCLTRLLDDNSELVFVSDQKPISYVDMHYRVSDLAADFISQILGLRYESDANPAIRDQAIQTLRQSLTTLQVGRGSKKSPVKQR